MQPNPYNPQPVQIEEPLVVQRTGPAGWVVRLPKDAGKETLREFVEILGKQDLALAAYYSAKGETAVSDGGIRGLRAGWNYWRRSWPGSNA